MKQRVWSGSVTIWLSLMIALSASGSFEVLGIPNSSVPAPDGHPHSCGVPGHPQFIDGTVTWADANAVWNNGNLTNPDETCHQHRSNGDFGGNLDDTHEPYSAYAVWDNENFRYSTNDPFDRGHGFINEFDQAGGGSHCIPDYRFSSRDRQGNPTTWPAQVQARVREAFDMWGAIESDRSWLATGIAFQEDSDAEIVIYWETLPPNWYGVFDPVARPTTLVLNNSTNWYLNANPAGIGGGQAHFLTVVLHETGHVVGLEHQNDPGELMYFSLNPRTTFFQNPSQDAGCVEGVRDLYSIPAPDLGDAPDPSYPTFLIGSNGGRSLFIGRESLGAGPTSWEWEARIPPPDNDTVCDGLGFQFVNPFLLINVLVSVTDWQSPRYNNPANYELYLAIWIDLNENGWWDHPSEMVVFERLSPSTWGRNMWFHTYNVTADDITPLWVRARLVYANTGMNLFPWGLLPATDTPDNGGEVEDYPLCLPDPSLPWPMFGGSVSHDRYTATPGPCSNNTIWTYTAGGGLSYSSPAIANGIVYFGALDGKVYAVDAGTGAPIWNYTTGAPIYSSPAVSGDRVYVGSEDGNLYALSASTGQFLWNFTNGGGGSSPTVADGVVYIGSNHKKLYALDAESGTVLWSHTVGSNVFSSPTVADGKVFFGAGDGLVYAVDLNGTRCWSYPTGNLVYSTPAVVDGKVYLGSTDNTVYCLDADSGSVEWNFTTGGPIHCSPAVAYGKVFIGSADGNFYGLDSATGSLLWSDAIGYGGYSSPAVACKKKVFVGTSNGLIFSLQPESGAILWSYNTGSQVYCSPAVANETMYVGAFNGKLYAFRSYHDISATGSVPIKSVVGVGYSVKINLTVRNVGDFQEAFSIVTYASSTFINGTSTFVVDSTSAIVDKGSSAHITVTWNTAGFDMGNYSIGAYAFPVKGETYTADNMFADGTIVISHEGDITGDFKIDIQDLARVAAGFGSIYINDPEDPRYGQYWHPTPCPTCPHTPNADINGDGKIDIKDVAIPSRYFGWHR